MRTAVERQSEEAEKVVRDIGEQPGSSISLRRKSGS
jgi:hypothetical protein